MSFARRLSQRFRQWTSSIVRGSNAIELPEVQQVWVLPVAVGTAAEVATAQREINETVSKLAAQYQQQQAASPPPANAASQGAGAPAVLVLNIAAAELTASKSVAQYTLVTPSSLLSADLLPPSPDHMLKACIMARAWRDSNPRGFILVVSRRPHAPAMAALLRVALQAKKGEITSDYLSAAYQDTARLLYRQFDECQASALVDRNVRRLDTAWTNLHTGIYDVVAPPASAWPDCVNQLHEEMRLQSVASAAPQLMAWRLISVTLRCLPQRLTTSSLRPFIMLLAGDAQAYTSLTAPGGVKVYNRQQDYISIPVNRVLKGAHVLRIYDLPQGRPGVLLATLAFSSLQARLSASNRATLTLSREDVVVINTGTPSSFAQLSADFAVELDFEGERVDPAPAEQSPEAVPTSSGSLARNTASAVSLTEASGMSQDLAPEHTVGLTSAASSHQRPRFSSSGPSDEPVDVSRDEELARQLQAHYDRGGASENEESDTDIDAELARAFGSSHSDLAVRENNDSRPAQEETVTAATEGGPPASSADNQQAADNGPAVARRSSLRLTRGEANGPANEAPASSQEPLTNPATVVAAPAGSGGSDTDASASSQRPHTPGTDAATQLESDEALARRLQAEFDREAEEHNQRAQRARSAPQSAQTAEGQQPSAAAPREERPQAEGPQRSRSARQRSAGARTAEDAQLHMILQRLMHGGHAGPMPVLDLLRSVGFVEEERMSMSAISALPVGKVTATSSMLERSCQICMGQYEVDEDFTTLPCLHQYHPMCIESWLVRRTTCPVCLTDVVDGMRSAGAEMERQGIEQGEDEGRRSDGGPAARTSSSSVAASTSPAPSSPRQDPSQAFVVTARPLSPPNAAAQPATRTPPFGVTVPTSGPSSAGSRREAGLDGSPTTTSPESLSWASHPSVETPSRRRTSGSSPRNRIRSLFRHQDGDSEV